MNEHGSSDQLIFWEFDEKCLSWSLTNLRSSRNDSKTPVELYFISLLFSEAFEMLNVILHSLYLQNFVLKHRQLVCISCHKVVADLCILARRRRRSRSRSWREWPEKAVNPIIWSEKKLHMDQMSFSIPFTNKTVILKGASCHTEDLLFINSDFRTIKRKWKENLFNKKCCKGGWCIFVGQNLKMCLHFSTSGSWKI